MNKKGIRIIAGICFILYAALNYNAFVQFFSGNDGWPLTSVLLYSAALVVGIGALINRPIVSAIGGLYFVAYNLFHWGFDFRVFRFPYRFVQSSFLCVVASALLVVLCFAKSASKGLGIVSAILWLAREVCWRVVLKFYAGVNFSLPLVYIISIVVLIVGLILIGFAFHQKKAKKAKMTVETYEGEANENDATAYDTEIDGYCGLGKHVLLLLFTCGIWLYIWIYRTTRLLNCVKGEEERNPTTKLLLCMFIPFYYIYWTYKSAQRIDKMAKTAGIDSDLSTLCLILAIFVGIIPPILMQDKINSVVKANRSPKVEAQPAKAEPQPEKAPEPANKMNTVEELKAYKELLDMGVITQEEFDAKKKQLLGL